MSICPHCGKLPPRLFPTFFVYLFMTLVAVGSAVYFRPFGGSPAEGLVKPGVMWVSFALFLVFALIFAFVCFVTWNNYSKRSYRKKVSKPELERYLSMKKHIEGDRHIYENGSIYCSICGARSRKK